MYTKNNGNQKMVYQKQRFSLDFVINVKNASNCPKNAENYLKFCMTAVFFLQKLILRHHNTNIYDHRLNELYMLFEVKVFPGNSRYLPGFPGEYWEFPGNTCNSQEIVGNTLTSISIYISLSLWS